LVAGPKLATTERSSKRYFVMALAATVWLALAACGAVPPAEGGPSAESWTDPPPATAPTPKVTESSQITLPLSRLEFDSRAANLVFTAAQVLRAKCLARFAIESTDHTTLDPNSVGPALERRYGVVDLGTAQKFGYHAPDTGGTKENDKSSGNGWNPSQAEFEVTFGREPDGSALKNQPVDSTGAVLPQGGCAAEADLTLTGGRTLSLDIVQQLAGQAAHLAEADARVQEVWAKWSSCMATNGYTYDSPWQPNDQYHGPTPTSDEIKTAVIDVNCRLKTNLVGIWMIVESGYQRALIAKHEAEIVGVQEIVNRQIATAKEVVAQG
jgi:hypothetical protein